MAYNLIPFKTSRGVAAYVEANAPAVLSASEIFPHKSSGYRNFPNVTILVTTFSEDSDNPGCYHVNVIVSIRTACTPGAKPGAEYASEALVGAIVDLFEFAVGTDRSVLADRITDAGRTWAVDDSGGADPDKAAFALANADMTLFKVDSICPLPGATSVVEKDEKSQCWVDDFPYALVVRATDATEPRAD